MDYLSPIVFAYVLNQSCGHWLISDVLHCHFHEENQVVLSIENVMDDDLIIIDELFLLAYNIRREVINVLDFFHSFLRKYDNKKSCNMVSLMLKAFL